MPKESGHTNIADNNELHQGERRTERAHLKLQCLNHVSIVVSSVEKSKLFYRDILGFLEVKRPGTLQERGVDGCWLHNYGVGIHLIEGNPLKRPKEIYPEQDHFSFQCENVCEVESVLKALNLEYKTDEIDIDGVGISQVRQVARMLFRLLTLSLRFFSTTQTKI